MNEVTAKLVRDMRWRLQRGGAKYRPKDKEVETWGAFTIPGLVPFLLSFAILGSGWLFSELSHVRLSEDAFITSMFISMPVLYWLRGVLNFRFKLGAYGKLLSTNERFMLVEYTKYLKRQIARAKDEPALGGEAEVKRLTELYTKLSALLEKGVGIEHTRLRSDLAAEADLAEAMVETYAAGQGDGLAQLDARLPDELRQRIADLDSASEATRPKVAQ